MKTCIRSIFCVALSSLFAMPAFADVPMELPFSGQLVVGGVPETGVKSITIMIWDRYSSGMMFAPSLE